MINIYIANKENWGGTFQYTELLIKALKKERKKTSIYFTESTWRKKYKNSHYIRLNLISVFFINLIVFFNFHKMIGSNIIQKVTRLPNTFFHKESTWIFPSNDLISCICKGKKIIPIHDLMHRLSSFPEVGGFLRKRIRDYKFKKLIKNANVILVDSKVGKKHVQELFSHKKDNIRILEFFPQINVSKKKNIKLSKQKYLFYPAQFWPHKNHKNLILAISKLAKKDKSIKLFLVGHKIRLYNSLKLLCIQNNCEKNIIFYGYVNSLFLSNLYSNARALVMPSFLGPTNIPPIEAFLHACPVLLSDVYAAREQCKNNALYFNPNSVKSIYLAINKIWFNDKIYKRKKNKSKLKSKVYSIKNFSKKLIQFIC